MAACVCVGNLQSVSRPAASRAASRSRCARVVRCHGNPAGATGPLVICGVSGCGKSHVAQLLSAALDCNFYEGDAFHPPDNIEKMSRGVPLTDKDRLPWLQALAHIIDVNVSRNQSAVVSCSALKAAYRDVLAGVDDVTGLRRADVAFVLLDPPRPLLQQWLEERYAEGSHFMPPCLLDSQLAALQYSDSELWMHVTADDQGNYPGAKAIVEQILRKLASQCV